MKKGSKFVITTKTITELYYTALLLLKTGIAVQIANASYHNKEYSATVTVA